jgi:hypothetical protein
MAVSDALEDDQDLASWAPRAAEIKSTKTSTKKRSST